MKPFTYYELKEIFAGAGCPLCALRKQETEKYLGSLLHEYATDPEVVDGFRHRRGMCNQHSWQLLSFPGNATNIAYLYEAVVRHLNTTLPLDVNTRPGLFSTTNQQTNKLADTLSSQAKCMCCSHINDYEKRVIDTLCKEIVRDEQFHHAYQECDGLCLPHFRMVLKQGKDKATHMIVDIQREKWLQLRYDLDQFLGKTGERIAGDLTPEEALSWKNAIHMMSGDMGLFGVDE